MARIKIDNQLTRRINEYCIENGTNLTDLINGCLRQELRSYEKTKKQLTQNRR